jgi:hypothetical protein
MEPKLGVPWWYYTVETVLNSGEKFRAAPDLAVMRTFSNGKMYQIGGMTYVNYKR